MNRKLLLIGIVVLALLIPTTTAFGYYATVSGELRDSKTNALWAAGASVEVFNCNTLATINTAILPAGTSTFSINVGSVVTATPMCIEVNFNADVNGKPGNASKGAFANRASNSGDLNTGVYFTGTGPTVVTLSDLSATPTMATGGLWVVIAVLALGLLVSGGLIVRRRATRS